MFSPTTRPVAAPSVDVDAPLRRILLAGCVLVVAGCGRSDPEREVRAAVGAMAKAIEERTPARFLEHVADDFTRESEAFGKRDVQRILAGLLLRNEKIGVTAVVQSVVVSGDTVRTQVRVLATGGSGLLPERGRAWEFNAAWRRDKGSWRVYNAEWREGI